MTRTSLFLFLALTTSAFAAADALAHQVPDQTPQIESDDTTTGIPRSLLSSLPGIAETEPPETLPVIPEPDAGATLDDFSFFSQEELEILEAFNTELIDATSRFLPPQTSLLGITPTTRCLEVSYTPGDIVLLHVAPFADLRIEMPVTILTSKLGGGSLWEAIHAEGTRHLWLKSASLTPEAAETSLTVIDEELNAYDIILQRENVPGYTCAIIKLSPELDFTRELSSALEAQTNFYRDSDSPSGEIFLQQLASLQAEIAELRLEQSNSMNAAQQAATNRINEIHSQIYAGYTWFPEDDNDPYAQRLSESILSVHDDGVRTFIRVEEMPSVGLVAIQGNFAGETQLVQTSYNPLLGMYTVTGIYDRLFISGGAEDARAVVSRIEP